MKSNLLNGIAQMQTFEQMVQGSFLCPAVEVYYFELKCKFALI